MAATLSEERRLLLKQVNELTDRPLFYLSFVWLSITVLELTDRSTHNLETIGYTVWAIFALDFALELIIAPGIKQYLKENWLTGLSLLLPALRILRVMKLIRYIRFLHSLRSLSLVKIVASLNRNISAIRDHATYFGLRYVFTITAILVVVSVVGILNFEKPYAQQQGLGDMNNYGDALWWTVMMITTIGSDYTPHTVAGRVLAVIVSLYAIAIFGYVTAILASLLIEKRKDTSVAKIRQ